MKKIRFASLSMAFILMLLPFAALTSAANESEKMFDNVKSFDIVAFDTKVDGKGVYVYTNDGNTDKILLTKDYNFGNTNIFIFDSDGMMFEAGGGLYSNVDERLGSPQLSVTVPAGGFIVAYDGVGGLNTLYRAVMQGAMLYNATMTIDYVVKATVDREAKKLTVEYDNPAPSDNEAKKFLFIGNSETYFNGIPIKFKALCRAAGIKVEVDYCTEGSSYLYQYAKENEVYAGKFRNKLKNKKYDYVVLQNGSGSSKQDMDEALDIMLPLIRENGAEPVLYMRYSDKYGKSGLYSATEFDYGVYSETAEKYGIKMMPSGLSFIFCYENFADVVPYEALYADDHNHHSGYASYMLAATWMYSLFGVSPVGNTFTAHYPADVVKVLQECAVMACDNTYDFSNPAPASREIDGVKYVNVAQGCKYTTTGEVYESDQWSDTGSDGKLLYKLTDGNVSDSGNDLYIGAHGGSSTEVVIDLGKMYAVKQIETDLWGNSGWGIPDPSNAKVTFYISKDGDEFTKLGETESTVSGDGWKQGIFNATTVDTMNARYVKVSYEIGGKFRWVSEINVFGANAKAEPVDESSEVSDDKSSEESHDESSESETSVSENPSSETPDDEKKGGLGTGSIIALIGGGIAVAVALGVVFASKKKSK